MRLKIFSSTVGLLFLTLGVYAAEQKREEHRPFDLKEALRKVTFSPDVDVLRSGAVKDTVNIGIYFYPADLRELLDSRLKVEARFYVGTRQGQEKQIKDEKRNIENSYTGVKLDWDDACPVPGVYWAKVWLSVRHWDGKEHKAFAPLVREYQYACRDPRRAIKLEDLGLRVSMEPDPNTFVSRDLFRILQVQPSMPKAAYADIVGNGRVIDVDLYSYRDGNAYPLSESKDLLMVNHAPTFSLKIKEVCGKMRSWHDEVFGKEVEIGCKINVENRDGSPDHRYAQYTCHHRKFICHDR